jgi:hypothetical protein
MGAWAQEALNGWTIHALAGRLVADLDATDDLQIGGTPGSRAENACRWKGSRSGPILHNL